MTTKTFTIDPRYNGPDDITQGGYVSGLLNEALGGGITQTTLRAPTPLGVAVEIKVDGEGAALNHGDILLAEGITAELDLSCPAPPSWEDAGPAMRNFTGFGPNVANNCVVCAPRRGGHDGYGVYPGLVDGRDIVASQWQPKSWLGDGQGMVTRLHMWLALDCAGHFSIFDAAERAFLGRMTGEVIGQARVGEKCIVIGWPIGLEGRKGFAGTAIYAEDGRLLGRTQQIIIKA